MQTITLYLNQDRAEFLRTKANGFTIDMKPDTIGDLYEVRISFESFDMAETMLRLFHCGIELGMKQAEKVVNASYKPTQYKVDDVMGLAHD